MLAPSSTERYPASHLSAPLDLALIGFESAEGQALVNDLRNSGLAVHPHYAEDPPGLTRLLQDAGHYLYLLDFDSARIERGEAVATIQNRYRHASLVFIAADPLQALATATACGARDVVHRSERERLAFLLRREQADLTQRREIGQLAERLNETEQRCQILIDTSRDAIAYVHAGMHVHANPVYAELFGFSQPGDLEGLPLMDLIAPDERPGFKKHVLRELEDSDECRTAEVECLGAGGAPFSAALEFRPAVVDGEPCTQIVIRDKAPQRALEERIAELSSRDILTGVYNRQFFMELLESRLSRSDGLAQMLMRLSIVNFSRLRGRAGVVAGDRLVQEVASVIQRLVDDSVILGRFGENDFLLLSEYTHEPARFAEDLFTALDSSSYTLPEGADPPEFAIGIAGSDQPRVGSASEFVNRVLRAGHHAEQAGNARLAYAHRVIGAIEEPTADADMISKIDQALAGEGFRLNYQPVVSLQGDSREYYAVLVRLPDDSEGDLLPEAFLGHARQSGRLTEIDRWVIRTSIRDIARLQENGRKTNFFINVSGPGIEDDSLLLWICDCLREFQAKGSWLTFQFNDADLRDHPSDAQRLLSGLKTIGCRTSINRYRDDPERDELLHELPIDTVRIAPELTTRLDDEQNYRRLERLNAHLQTAGKTTVATAVENASSLALLWQMRVSFLQGFFLQHPADRILYGERL